MKSLGNYSKMRSASGVKPTPWRPLTPTTYTRTRRGLYGMVNETGTIFDIIKGTK